MEDVVSKLHADEQLRVFLKPDVDVAQIASAIIAKDATNTASSSASEDFSHTLAVAIQTIDSAIEDYIGASHTDLLDHVGSVDGLKSKVKLLHADVSDVQAAILRMDSDIHKVHRALQRNVQQLRNVELCTTVLQKVLRFQSLVETLSSMSLPQSDTVSSADNDTVYTSISTALREAELILEGEDPAFRSLGVVAPALPTLRNLRSELTRRMKGLLRQGMAAMDQTTIGRALQTLFQLGASTLSEHVQAAVNAALQDVETKCLACLRESSFDDAKLKADVWAACQAVLDTLSSYALQVWNLQRVLLKSPAPGGRTFLDLVLAPDEPTLFATFWDISCALVRDLMTQTLEYRAPVKQALVTTYPKIRSEANSVVTQLQTTTARLSLDTLVVCASREERQQLVGAFTPLLDAFVARSARRIAAPVQMMFPQSANYHPSPPSRSDMAMLLKIIQQEIDGASHDQAFLAAILPGVETGIDLFCRNIVAIAHNSPSTLALPPSNQRTTAHAHNVALVTVCVQLDDALGAWRRPELDSTRDRVHNLALRLLGKYLAVLTSKLEGILATMHEETFGDAASQAPMHGSRFMAEFGIVFQVIEAEHLQRLGLDAGSSIREASLDAMCTRLLSYFVRHAALVRPLGEAGKCRLASDMAQLEMHMSNLSTMKTSETGLAWEEFKAFRHLLFVETARVCRDPKVDKIRPSNVWHHLLGRGPVALQTPAQARGWTQAAYVAWMEKEAGLAQYSPPVAPSDVALGLMCWTDRTLAMAAEQAIWKEVHSCLDAYAQRSSAKGNVQVDSTIYDVLIDSGAALLAGYELATKAYLYPSSFSP
ncbi:hypothetical protein LEN26_018997 [Aphanomyces euteiches]|nr:hypothetical protein LEN26_018997 [Aphanomyces euteiches]KAH9129780.1 hypothetical protein AeMF1_000200 [Aphanomyces euteiches]KAH9183170.1 hypothetical protein AeNC1_014852 [Aphanomyces euteiches]